MATEQAELNVKVKLTALQKACKNWVEMKEAEKEYKAKVKAAGEDVLKELKKAKRDSIDIGAFTFERVMQPEKECLYVKTKSSANSAATVPRMTATTLSSEPGAGALPSEGTNPPGTPIPKPMARP